MGSKLGGDSTRGEASVEPRTEKTPGDGDDPERQWRLETRGRTAIDTLVRRDSREEGERERDWQAELSADGQQKWQNRTGSCILWKQNERCVSQENHTFSIG